MSWRYLSRALELSATRLPIVDSETDTLSSGAQQSALFYAKGFMNSLGYYPVLALGAVAAIIGYALLARKPKTLGDAFERERRGQLAAGGRIIDGTVIDVQE